MNVTTRMRDEMRDLEMRDDASDWSETTVMATKRPDLRVEKRAERARRLQWLYMSMSRIYFLLRFVLTSMADSLVDSAHGHHRIFDHNDI